MKHVVSVMNCTNVIMSMTRQLDYEVVMQDKHTFLTESHCRVYASTKDSIRISGIASQLDVTYIADRQVLILVHIDRKTAEQTTIMIKDVVTHYNDESYYSLDMTEEDKVVFKLKGYKVQDKIFQDAIETLQHETEIFFDKVHNKLGETQYG